jgi:hypothetical protein
MTGHRWAKRDEIHVIQSEESDDDASNASSMGLAISCDYRRELERAYVLREATFQRMHSQRICQGRGSAVGRSIVEKHME